MKNIRTYTGRIVKLDRMPSSRNGNPRYSVSFFNMDNGDYCTFITAVDSSLAYSLPNYVSGPYSSKMLEVSIGTHYGKETLENVRIVHELRI